MINMSFLAVTLHIIYRSYKCRSEIININITTSATTIIAADDILKTIPVISIFIFTNAIW